MKCRAVPSGVKIEKEKYSNNLNLTAATSFNSESESDGDGDGDVDGDGDLGSDVYDVRVEDIYRKDFKSNYQGNEVPRPTSYINKPTPTLPSVTVSTPAPVLTPSLTSAKARMISHHTKPSWDSLEGQKNQLVSQTLPKDFVFAQPTNFPSREIKK